MPKITINHILGKFTGPNESAILQRLKDKKHFSKLRDLNFELTRKKLQEINQDVLITQAQGAIEDTTRAINTLSKRLREWYELHCPEFSKSIQSHEKFAELIQKKSKKELLKELKRKFSIGSDLSQDDLKPILELASRIQNLSKLKQSHESYLEKKLKSLAPNLTAVAGPQIAAQLLAHTGSLKRLAFFPASTIQVLGAEEALFRHLKTGSKPPKHGLIINHPLVQNADKKNRGKVARMLADKLSIAARVDFFKGKFTGDKLLKELEKKVKDL